MRLSTVYFQPVDKIWVGGTTERWEKREEEKNSKRARTTPFGNQVLCGHKIFCSNLFC